MRTACPCTTSAGDTIRPSNAINKAAATATTPSTRVAGLAVMYLLPRAGDMTNSPPVRTRRFPSQQQHEPQQLQTSGWPTSIPLRRALRKPFRMLGNLQARPVPKWVREAAEAGQLGPEFRLPLRPIELRTPKTRAFLRAPLLVEVANRQFERCTAALCPGQAPVPVAPLVGSPLF